MTPIPTSALVQMLGAVLLLGSSGPITRYALLGGAAPFWFALGRAGFFALAHSAVAWVPAGRSAILSNATLVWTVPGRRAP